MPRLPGILDEKLEAEPVLDGVGLADSHLVLLSGLIEFVCQLLHYGCQLAGFPARADQPNERKVAIPFILSARLKVVFRFPGVSGPRARFQMALERMRRI